MRGDININIVNIDPFIEGSVRKQSREGDAPLVVVCESGIRDIREDVKDKTSILSR